MNYVINHKKPHGNHAKVHLQYLMEFSYLRGCVSECCVNELMGFVVLYDKKNKMLQRYKYIFKDLSA